MTKDALWKPPTGVTLLGPRRYAPTQRIITLSTGERVRVTIEGDNETGTVTHVEHDHTLDAIVRPKTVTIKTRKGPDALN